MQDLITHKKLIVKMGFLGLYVKIMSHFLVKISKTGKRFNLLWSSSFMLFPNADSTFAIKLFICPSLFTYIGI